MSHPTDIDPGWYVYCRWTGRMVPSPRLLELWSMLDEMSKPPPFRVRDFTRSCLLPLSNEEAA